MKIHHLTVADAFASLKSGLAGLSDAEVARATQVFQIVCCIIRSGQNLAAKFWPWKFAFKSGRGWSKTAIEVPVTSQVVADLGSGKPIFNNWNYGRKAKRVERYAPFLALSVTLCNLVKPLYLEGPHNSSDYIVPEHPSNSESSTRPDDIFAELSFLR